MSPHPTPACILQAQRQAIVAHNRRYPDQRFPSCAVEVLRQAVEKEAAEHTAFLEASNDQT